MPAGEHNHFENHYTRIVKTSTKEKLQLICKADGVVFREVEITESLT